MLLFHSTPFVGSRAYMSLGLFSLNCELERIILFVDFGQKIIIIITDLYSAFRSEHTEAFEAAQED